EVRRLRGDTQRLEARLQNDIDAQNAENNQIVNRAIRRILLALLLLGGGATILLIANLVSVSTGIRKLTEGSSLLARNQLGDGIDFGPHRRDEFAVLGQQFNKMADAIREQRLANHEQLKALEEARTTAENATRLKSDFLANMSHELRAPMHIIMNFTKLVVDE